MCFDFKAPQKDAIIIIIIIILQSSQIFRTTSLCMIQPRKCVSLRMCQTEMDYILCIQSNLMDSLHDNFLFKCPSMSARSRAQ